MSSTGFAWSHPKDDADNTAFYGKFGSTPAASAASDTGVSADAAPSPLFASPSVGTTNGGLSFGLSSGVTSNTATSNQPTKATTPPMVKDKSKSGPSVTFAAASPAPVDSPFEYGGAAGRGAAVVGVSTKPQFPFSPMVTTKAAGSGELRQRKTTSVSTTNKAPAPMDISNLTPKKKIRFAPPPKASMTLDGGGAGVWSYGNPATKTDTENKENKSDFVSGFQPAAGLIPQTSSAVPTLTSDISWVLLVGSSKPSEVALGELERKGTIVSRRIAPGNGNWMALEYAKAWDAVKASKIRPFVAENVVYSVLPLDTSLRSQLDWKGSSSSSSGGFFLNTQAVQSHRLREEDVLLGMNDRSSLRAHRSGTTKNTCEKVMDFLFGWNDE